MYHRNLKIVLTLTTACGAVGTAITEGDSFGPMDWTREPLKETTNATFQTEGLDEDSVVSIDGDDWRSLESDGCGADHVAYWTRRDVDLEDAVDCAIQNVDPDGRDECMEENLDLLRERVDLLAEVNQTLVQFIQALGDSVNDPEVFAAVARLEGLRDLSDI